MIADDFIMESKLNRTDGCAGIEKGGKICFVGHATRDADALPTRDQSLLLIGVRESDGTLFIFVDPEWRASATRGDLEYLESLLDDFKERIESDPEGLFAQLSSLNVGPIVTMDVTSYRAESEMRRMIPANFRRLI